MIRIPATVHPSCLDFVITVEELLQQRRDEGAHTFFSWQQDDWGPRKWHHTELEDMVYSSYKRMRQGHITRPPRRETVMEIADYLACTLQERNRLLVAAHTLPVEPYFEGDELRRLVVSASEIAKDFSMPLMVINRDWRIHYLNKELFAFYKLAAADLAAFPAEQLNVLHLLFDPASPLRSNLIANPAAWRSMALQTIYGFKMANVLCQFEPWYQRVVNQLMQLPEFPQCWNSAEREQLSLSTVSPGTGFIFETTLIGPQGLSKTMLVRPITISIGYFQFAFPQIIGLLPADSVAHAYFREIGLATPHMINPDGHFVL